MEENNKVYGKLVQIIKQGCENIPCEYCDFNCFDNAQECQPRFIAMRIYKKFFKEKKNEKIL